MAQRTNRDLARVRKEQISSGFQLKGDFGANTGQRDDTDPSPQASGSLRRPGGSVQRQKHYRSDGQAGSAAVKSDLRLPNKHRCANRAGCQHAQPTKQAAIGPLNQRPSDTECQKVIEQMARRDMNEIASPEPPKFAAQKPGAIINKPT